MSVIHAMLGEFEWWRRLVGGYWFHRAFWHRCDRKSWEFAKRRTGRPLTESQLREFIIPEYDYWPKEDPELVSKSKPDSLEINAR